MTRSHLAQAPVFRALEGHFGPRGPPTLTPANRPFHLLEHPETLWLKALYSYILSFHHIDSFIWLHDAVWLSPPPTDDLLDAANRHATATISLGDSPLFLRVLQVKEGEGDSGTANDSTMKENSCAGKTRPRRPWEDGPH